MSESVISDYGSEDVAQTIAIITQLKAENVDLKRNFDNLKGLHLQLVESNRTLQARYAALFDERNNVEKQYQSLCESWRVELEEKQRQLEAAKAQILGPRDLEVLRVKLLEELDAPYRAKTENLAKEAESSHAAYMKLRREYEELQNTYRSLEVRTVGEQEAHRLEATAQARDLRDKAALITMLQGKLATTETQLRGLQRDLEAARYSHSQMKQELDEVRRLKEKAVVEREQAAVAADKRVKAAEEEAANLMSFVESVTRKNRHLVTELTESQRAAEDLFASNVRLQGAQTALQGQLDSAVRLAATEKAALMEEHEEAIRKLEDKVTSLQAEGARKDSLVSELKLAQQDELTKLVAVWEVRVAEEKRGAADKQRELLDLKADLNEKIASLQRQADERRREDEAALRSTQGEADSALREAAAERQRGEALTRQLAEANAALEAAKAELADVKAELVKSQMTATQLVERRQELEQRVQRAEEQALQARSSRDSLAAELESVRREAEEERAAVARQEASSRAAWGLEKAALAKRYQAAVKELGARHEAELRKLKRRSRGAVAAVAALTDEVADLKFKAAEAKHVSHMSEVLYLNTAPATARSASPYRDSTYSPGGAATTPGPYSGGGGYGYYSPYSPSGGGGGARPITAPSYFTSSMGGAPPPNVVIVTGGNAGGGSGANGASVAAAAAAGAAAGAAASAQAAQQQQYDGSGGDNGGEGGGGGRVVEGAVGGGAGLVDSALLSSIAALRQRQQEYMHMAPGSAAASVTAAAAAATAAARPHQLREGSCRQLLARCSTAASPSDGGASSRNSRSSTPMIKGGAGGSGGGSSTAAAAAAAAGGVLAAVAARLDPELVSLLWAILLMRPVCAAEIQSTFYGAWAEAAVPSVAAMQHAYQRQPVRPAAAGVVYWGPTHYHLVPALSYEGGGMYSAGFDTCQPMDGGACNAGHSGGWGGWFGGGDGGSGAGCGAAAGCGGGGGGCGGGGCGGA
ncbi:hypothetical protein HYH02_006614 [Chlamydomonas schloesseri]|uniref:Uncharacterized protein n=1 Tax=Chlamydomonas schloesseri TaxID=2026947 RepID=A0A835T594_9CHLO|nr:hypothetical protein HYH02_006614 [Chlamydomonas schloesseri]|eukprot:KAG2439089.1 hypothetical protein HYH02_006614 [Chlamydomonas schloesseri]